MINALKLYVAVALVCAVSLQSAATDKADAPYTFMLSMMWPVVLLSALGGETPHE
ncbi:MULTISPECIES: hypothetical protein [unclassified Sulfitobacter]|uniref:hypothetical protein n=1 Tax=Sulfitobacter phage pCB2047-C TaxID=754043 RepID=UPI0002C044B5|nr:MULTISPECIES: hypothetical protein [unclassified Sulfitobacter]YP_007675289.1 hypothetical protein SUBG_00032 [Sulfitobacter phage pCB2047-C]YP_007675441.1 hypothetical protein SUAG_00049 [Sulfitobacter phage pCB2047-A]YP_009146243.1 hypothetical protein SUFP_069 [Sulfitobacter phage NYA-2014a]AGG91202.1 hypothetical protein SUBG_00032 [Sulfitobacter phage pCB2047-C]AGH30775.1 hypothetical protein SUAG_00049 [Sulfitobacter phage pCB2047-A]AIM40700.1 hypothetical protein SUFP_069 [Sulfitoba